MKKKIIIEVTVEIDFDGRKKGAEAHVVEIAERRLQHNFHLAGCSTTYGCYGVEVLDAKLQTKKP